MTENKSITDTNDKELVLSRDFKAPKELVFKVWSEIEHLKKWWGPKGYTMNVTSFDLRPGGIFHYSQRSPEGVEMWGKFVYSEIIAPEKIVFTNSFSDEAGNTVRAPFSATWPMEILNTLTLTEQNGTTTLNLRGGPLNPTAEELETFLAAIGMLQQGFGGTLDQLAEYISSVK